MPKNHVCKSVCVFVCLCPCVSQGYGAKWITIGLTGATAKDSTKFHWPRPRPPPGHKGEGAMDDERRTVSSAPPSSLRTCRDEKNRISFDCWHEDLAAQIGLQVRPGKTRSHQLKVSSKSKNYAKLKLLKTDMVQVSPIKTFAWLFLLKTAK